MRFQGRSRPQYDVLPARHSQKMRSLKQHYRRSVGMSRNTYCSDGRQKRPNRPQTCPKNFILRKVYLPLATPKRFVRRSLVQGSSQFFDLRQEQERRLRCCVLTICSAEQMPTFASGLALLFGCGDVLVVQGAKLFSGVSVRSSWITTKRWRSLACSKCSLLKF